MTAADFEASTEELKKLALEIRDRYDLMLKLDVDPEDADLHRELLDLANEALEDIAMAEAGRARRADAGLPVEVERPSPEALWAEWNAAVRFCLHRWPPVA